MSVDCDQSALGFHVAIEDIIRVHPHPSGPKALAWTTVCRCCGKRIEAFTGTQRWHTVDYVIQEHP